MPARSVPNRSSDVGRVLDGRYRLLEPIGSGASATVYLAEDTSLQRRVAVKLLHSGLVDNPAVRRRFRAEAQAAGRLNHVHIMAIYDWDDEGEAYLVTEFLGGGSLRALLDAGHRLTLSQALLLFLHAAQGLADAHQNGLVHRDIKPANLMFGRDGRLRIGDFGIARTVSEAAWTEPEGALIGTATYAAPEQATGASIDGRADVYSLALTVIEAVTGTVPHTEATPLATMVSRQDSDVEVPVELGPLRPVLAAATRADRDERSTADEIVAALIELAPELPRPTPLPLVISESADSSIQDSSIQDSSIQDRAVLVLDDTDDIELDLTDDRSTGGTGGGDLFDADEFLAPAPRRRWPWLVALLGIAGLVGLFWVGNEVQQEMARVETHIVGSYVGQQIDSVEDEFVLRRWTANIVTDRADGTEPGEVLQQTPEPGTVLPEGVSLTLVVSEGPVLRAVPMLVGRTKDEAIAAIAEANLSLGSINTAVFDENVPLGSVIETSLAAGAEVETGTSVDLVVSAGPAPRAVPVVSGLSFEDASNALVEAGLVPLRQEEYSETVPEGTVIAAEPATGAEVARDSEVAIIVSLGLPFVEVPNVRGMSAAEAADALEAAGFVVIDTVGPPNSNVVATSPEAGESRRLGTEISILTERG